MPKSSKSLYCTISSLQLHCLSFSFHFFIFTLLCMSERRLAFALSSSFLCKSVLIMPCKTQQPRASCCVRPIFEWHCLTSFPFHIHSLYLHIFFTPFLLLIPLLTAFVCYVVFLINSSTYPTWKWIRYFKWRYSMSLNLFCIRLTTLLSSRQYI